MSTTPSEADAVRFGAIVVVPFPFTDQSAAKKRPAVVISSARYNAGRPDIILMPVTSRVGGSSTDDVLLAGWEAAGLLKPSAVKPVIATFEQSLVIRILGRLGDEDQAALRGMLQRILG